MNSTVTYHADKQSTADAVDERAARDVVQLRASSFDPAAIQAVVFDFGNTLVPFGPEAVSDMNGALERVLRLHFGGVDRAALDEVRERDRLQPYENGYRENDIPTLCRNLVRSLYDVEPSNALVEELVAARYDSFVDAILLPEDVGPFLRSLGSTRALGVLSNYPDGDVVRHSMRQIGILGLFEAVVASGDVGWCKPDARPFAAIAERMGTSPEATLYVGDNWLADVQGAKGFGMSAALVTQYTPVEHFTPQAGDYEPDITLPRVTGLELVL